MGATRFLPRDFARDARGGVITLFALGLPALAVLSTGAVELAEVVNARSKLQSSVDAAALKGAAEIGADQTTATTERTRQFANESAKAVRSRWTVTTDVATNLTAGTVKVTQDAVRPSFFGSLLPPGGFHIGATATATALARTPLCVLALRSGGTQVALVQNNAGISAPACLVQSNSDIGVTNNGSVSAGKVQAATSASGSISPAPITDVPARVDPFASMAINVPATCNDYNASIGSGTFVVNPGVHCGTIDVYGSASLVLNPGEHYFSGGSLRMSGNSTVSGNDVVLVFKGQSTVEFSGNASLSFEGRRTGAYAGFVMVSDRSFTGTVSFSSPNARKLLGTIYLPGGTLDVSGPTARVGDLSDWTIVVANKIQASGTAKLTINSNYAAGSVPVPKGAGPKLGEGSRLVN
jgi:Flp pilus assembly protein TadG